MKIAVLRGPYLVDAGADAEFLPEGVVKIRDIGKPAIERDVENSRRALRQLHRRVPQACPKNVLVGRDACDALKHS